MFISLKLRNHPAVAIWGYSTNEVLYSDFALIFRKDG